MIAFPKHKQSASAILLVYFFVQGCAEPSSTAPLNVDEQSEDASWIAVDSAEELDITDVSLDTTDAMAPKPDADASTEPEDVGTWDGNLQSDAEDEEVLSDAPSPPLPDAIPDAPDGGAQKAEISSVWPEHLTRGATELVVVRGTGLGELIDASCEVSPAGECTLLWDERELLANETLLRVPIQLSNTTPTGAGFLTLIGTEGDSVHPFEVHLAPGEQEALIGTLDLGEVLTATPWADSEFFQAVSVETGGPFLFFTDAGWHRVYVSVLGIHEQELLGQTLSPGTTYLLAGNGETGPSIDGLALDIPLSEPKGLCFTEENGEARLFIADTTHHQIRVLNLSDETIIEMGKTIEPGHIATVVGTGEFGYGGDEGPALEARLFRPWRVKGCNGNLLQIGDVENYRLRVVNRSDTPQSVAGQELQPGIIRTVAGDGTLGFSGDGGKAEEAQVSIPKGMVTLPGTLVAFSDPENDRLRMVNLGTAPASYAGQEVLPGEIASLGVPGSFDGLSSTPGFNHPTGLTKDPLEGIWVADTYSHTIKLFNGTQHPLYRAGKATLPGDIADIYAGVEHYHAGTDGIGIAEESYLSSPFDVALRADRGELFLADEENRAIRRLKLWAITAPPTGALGPFPDLAALPGEQAILDTETGILSGSDGDWERALGVNNGVFDLEDFHLPEGETLTLIGAIPACIVSQGDLLIEGQLLVEAGSIPLPSGGNPSLGGSHGTPGAGKPTTDTSGYEHLIPLSGGQSGGSGAPGGGALVLAAGGNLTVTGLIYAQGITAPDGTGSGSGGGLRFHSKQTIQCTGMITAEGGKGPHPGGEGRIYLEAPEIDCPTSPTAHSGLKLPDFSQLPGY